MPSPTKSQKTIEELRLKHFGLALLDCWTTATNSASHAAFFDNSGYLPADTAHFALFSSIAAPELELINESLAERFPKDSQGLLRKCALASIAALIARQIVQESV
jgi:hypothetical protein